MEITVPNPALSTAVLYNQNVQLVCFGVILVLMARQDPANRSKRWLARMYICAMISALFDLADGWMPHWIGWSVSNLAVVAAYGCLQAGLVEFLGRGRRSRWLPMALFAGAATVFPLLALGADGQNRIFTAQDLSLCAQSAMCVWLLMGSKERETQLPRHVMGSFLVIYSAIELARVGIYLLTGKMPDVVSPHLEIASSMVYVAACSMLPMAFLWMMYARLHAHMALQMTTDPLTELLNRRGVEAAADLELARYSRGRQGFAVVLADIDHFKRLNDAYGHAAGDLVLRELARLFRAETRAMDVVGRLGGEEFVLLLPETDLALAAAMVERLRQALSHKRFELGAESVAVTVSYGMTVSRGRDGLSLPAMLREADLALYDAKGAGRDRCVIFAGANPVGSSVVFEALLGTA